MHLEWVVKAANAKKHILIEKPVALCTEDFKVMIDACISNNVVMMDGTMFMHHKRFENLLEYFQDPSMGKFSHIRSSFSFNGSGESFMNENIRVSSSGDPLGSLGDLGWYCIRLALMVYSGLTVRNIKENRVVWKSIPLICSAKCFKWTDDGVPLECEACVGFGSKENPWEKRLTFDCSFLIPFREKFEISIIGKNNTLDQVITCQDFVIPQFSHGATYTITSVPTSALVDNATRVLSTTENISFPECVQEALMFDEMNRVILNNSDDVSLKYFWYEVSYATQAIIDACMTSMKQNGKDTEIKSPFIFNSNHF